VKIFLVAATVLVSAPAFAFRFAPIIVTPCCTQPVYVQQAPAEDYSDTYNLGYQDGYQASHGWSQRHGYGPAYEQGFSDAWRAEHRY
jgi:hypothetical protein